MTVMIDGSPKSLVPFPAAITGGHPRDEYVNSNCKRIAAERLSELVDELKRRSTFTEVSAHSQAVEARIDLPIEGMFDTFVYIGVNTNWERPYTVRAEMSTQTRHISLMNGREMSFEGVLLFVDDFLAGFRAGQAAMLAQKGSPRQDRLVIGDEDKI